MLTTAEAAEAVQVTRDQIVLWCRSGQVAAVKDGRGRWSVDPESLDARRSRWEALSARLEALGGVRWDKDTIHLVYLNDAIAWGGLTFTLHPGGRPNTAALDGQPVTDTDGGIRHLWTGIDKVHVSLPAEHLSIRSYYGRPDEVFYLDADGRLQEMNLLERVIVAVADRIGADFGEVQKVRGGYIAPITSLKPLEAP